jgi:hypothetical protein
MKHRISSRTIRFAEIPRDGDQVSILRPGKSQIIAIRLLSRKGAVHGRGGHGEIA